MPLKKLTLEVSGGLGNQLFQVGTAVGLRDKGYVVAVDSIYNDLNGIRSTEIEELVKNLGIQYIKRNKFMLFLLKNPIIKKIYIYKIQRNTIYESKNFSIPIIPKDTSKKRIFGYWQTISSAEKIFQYLNNLVQGEIKKEIALHVRRGDYLLPQHSMHGALDGSYYMKAVQAAIAEGGQRNIVIFTDSLKIVQAEEWCKSLSLVFNVTFSELTSPWETMLEMARYSTIICSNSTFSWWAAYIGLAKNVILPDQWFINTKTPQQLLFTRSQVIRATFL